MNPKSPIILVAIVCATVTAGAVFTANLYRREAEAMARSQVVRQAERDRAAVQAQLLEQASIYRAAWIDPATGKLHRYDHICNQQCRDLRDAARNLRAQAAPVRAADW